MNTFQIQFQHPDGQWEHVGEPEATLEEAKQIAKAIRQYPIAIVPLRVVVSTVDGPIVFWKDRRYNRR